MSDTITVREEQPQDHAAIYALTEVAFRDRPYADGDEQDVVNRLRERGALTLSLVATREDKVVGQVTFSPARNSDGSHPWFALGPVSVLPEYQSQGIGAALINAGLSHLQSQGALGCILTGNPKYYCRFGFEPAPDNAPDTEPAEFFMLKLMNANGTAGSFKFHESFYG